MANREMKYRVGLELGDISQFKKALQDANKALSALGNLKIGDDFTTQLKDGALAAKELQQHLLNATNINTGKLDLSKLEASLKSGGSSLETYASRLQAMGPQGEQAFLRVASAIAKAELPLKRSSKLLDDLWLTMKNTMRWQLTNSILNGFNGQLQAAVRYAQDLDESLNRIQIVTKQSTEQMKEFAKSANEAASQLSTTTTDYTNAALIYYQQGLNDEEVADRVDTTIKLANVSNTSAETVSEWMTAIWNNFYDGSKSLEYYSDVMTALGATTASSSAEIAVGIQKFAAVANTVGLSYEYAASALATLTANTREAPEVVGNSLKTLFARIQGLKLGETLDDGTDMNKYSNALMAIGVNIKTVNGELKSMDQILEETAAKWSTLAKDQQTALAQTIAGVRQYNQFVALMDNWSDFQENLATAYDATGELNKQAGIFAESWEAARAQVKAATEDIYDSLINEDFFIDFDKGLANILHGLASSIDALGGMKGAIILAGLALTQAFGDRMAQGLRDLAYNFTVMTGEADRAQQQFKQTAGFVALDEAMRGNINSINRDETIAKTYVQYQDIQLQNTLNSLARQLTEEQYNQLSAQKDLITAMREMGIAYEGVIEKREKELEQIDQAIKKQENLNERSYHYGLGVSSADSDLWLKNLKIPGISDMNIPTMADDEKDSLDTILAFYRQLSTVGGQLGQLSIQFNGINDGIEGSSVLVEQLKNEFRELTGIDLYNTPLGESQERVREAVETVDQALVQLYERLQNYSGIEPETLERLREATNSLGTNMQSLGFTTNVTRQEADNFMLAAYNATIKTQDWATSVIDASKGLMQYGMVLQSVKNLGNIISNDNLSNGDRFIQIFTTLGMIIPTVVSAMKAMKGQVKEYTIETLTAKQVEEASLNQGKLNARQRIISTRLIRDETGALTGETEAIVANSAAWKAHPLLIIITAVSTAIAVFTFFNTIIENNTKKTLENYQASIDAAKAKEEETQANLDLIKSTKEALDVYAETGDNKEELDNLTRTLAEAYNLEGDALARLSGEYGDYSKVLDEAREKRKQELLDELEIQRGVLNQQEYKLKQAAGGKYVNFQGFQLLDNEENKIVEAMRDYLGLPSETSGSGIYASMTYDFNNAEDVVNLYDNMTEMFKHIDEYASDAYQSESGLLREAISWYNSMTDVVNEYKELNQLISRLEVQTGQSGLSISDDSINSVKEYKEWHKEVSDILEDEGYNLDTIEDIIKDIVDNSLNDGLQKIRDISDAIDEAKSKMKGSDLNKGWVDQYFESDNYDNAILASMNWGSLTALSFNEAYNAAKKYADINNQIISDSERLKDMQSILSTISKEKWDLDIDDYTKISNAIEWGKDGLIEFTTFLQMTQTEQSAYINAIISESYQDIMSSLVDSIEEAQAEIERNQSWIDEQNAEDLQFAEDTVTAWKKAYEAYNEFHRLQGISKESEFNWDRFEIDESKLGENFNWQEVFKQAPDEFKKTMNDATRDAQITIDAVAEAKDTIKNLQNDIDSKNKEIVITARVNFDTRLENIENSVDNIVAIYDAISKGVEETTDAMGNKIWGFSREAAKAIEAIYPGFIANAELLRDGTFALTDDMYQAFFDSANGQLAADTNSKAGMLQNIIIMLEQKKASAQSALEIAEKLATGEVTLDQLSTEEKETLLTNFVNGKSVANGEMLADEANMLIESDTNHANLWENVSDYSAQGAQNMSDNMARSTGLILQNLEKIRNAAWKTTQQMAMIANPEGAKDLGAIDTTSIWDNNKAGSWAKNINTSNANTFIDSLKEQTQVTSEDLFEYGSAKDAISRQSGKMLTEYYQSLINSFDQEIASAKIAQSKLLEGIDNAYDKLAKAQKGSSRSGSSNKQQYYLDKEKKTLDDILDRYHLITREIDNQNDILDDISNNVERTYGIDKIKNYKKELAALEKQQRNYNKKLEEANNWLAVDTAELERVFGKGSLEYTETGEILNYVSLLRKAVDEYNAFDTEYQAFQKKYTETSDKNAKDALEEEKALWEARKQAADREFEDRQKAIKMYEDSLDVQQEMIDALEENARKMADNKISQVEYRLEVVLDVKSMKDAIREFDKNVAEIFNDALTHGLDVAGLSKEQAEVEAAMYPEYAKQYRDLVALYESTDDYMDRERIIEDIKELQGNVLDSAEAIVEWVNSIEDIIPEAVDAAAERFSLFTDQLDHNTSVLDTIKELYALQGVTYKTMDGFNRLQRVAQERLESQVANAQLNKKWYDNAIVNLQEAQAALDSLGTGPEAEKDLRYDTFKKARDAYLEEFNKAQEAYLSSAKGAMETAQEMYLEQIERAVYKFGQTVSNGIGLDLLQDKYDHYIEKDERYLDKVNEAYQTTAWFNKLQKDIDETTNNATKERLKQLQEEINLRREGNKLSQYDLDILNAKYEVLKAQMALEDAQNAKNKLQLVRDRQGNWNYQYTADPTQVEDAEQDLLDAQNDWYNIAKKQVTNITGEIVSAWQECQDKIKEIYSDMTLTDQERSDRAAEIYKYYTDKIKYLEEEKQVAIADMTEAGNASLFSAAVVMGDKLTDLTGITADDIKNIVAEGGDDIIGLLTADNETIKNIIASNSDLIDLFDNVYAKDLDNMTANTDKFEDALRDTIQEAEDHFRDFGDTIKEVAYETDTTLGDLDNVIQDVSDSTDQLRDAGLDAADALWSMIDAAQEAAFSYADMAQEIWESVEALRALAAEQADYVSSKADLDNDEWTSDNVLYDKNVDYAAAIEYGIANGLFKYGDDTYNSLVAQREAKIKGENLEKDYYGASGAEADKTFSSYTQGGSLSKWTVGQYSSLDDWKRKMKNLGIMGFDTGGYTGDFNDAKLAFVHQKELILNPEDTKNILSAVNAVRELDDTFFANLEKAIDGNMLAAITLIAEKITSSFSPVLEPLEQNIHIDKVEFPNIISANGLEEAFTNLANDAAQWARRRS